jgi:hypothetical protein
MMTTTDTNNNNNNTKEERAKEKNHRMRERWDDCVMHVRQLKRKVLAASAVFGTSQWVKHDPEATWFSPCYAEDVTRHAALAEECLDDARSYAKRKGLTLPPLEFQSRSILESEALKPYLKRWRCAPTAETRARCAYPSLD